MKERNQELRDQVERRALVDNLLHGVHDKLVKRVKLLAHEALLIEVGGDVLPAVLLLVLVDLTHQVLVEAPRRVLQLL